MSKSAPWGTNWLSCWLKIQNLVYLQDFVCWTVQEISTQDIFVSFKCVIRYIGTLRQSQTTFQPDALVSGLVVRFGEQIGKCRQSSHLQETNIHKSWDCIKHVLEVTKKSCPTGLSFFWLWCDVIMTLHFAQLPSYIHYKRLMEQLDPPACRCPLSSPADWVLPLESFSHLPALNPSPLVCLCFTLEHHISSLAGLSLFILSHHIPGVFLFICPPWTTAGPSIFHDFAVY